MRDPTEIKLNEILRIYKYISNYTVIPEIYDYVAEKVLLPKIIG